MRRLYKQAKTIKDCDTVRLPPQRGNDERIIGKEKKWGNLKPDSTATNEKAGQQKTVNLTI